MEKLDTFFRLYDGSIIHMFLSIQGVPPTRFISIGMWDRETCKKHWKYLKKLSKGELPIGIDSIRSIEPMQ